MERLPNGKVSLEMIGVSGLEAKGSPPGVLRKFIVEMEKGGLRPTSRPLPARRRPLYRCATTMESASPSLLYVLEATAQSRGIETWYPTSLPECGCSKCDAKGHASSKN